MQSGSIGFVGGGRITSVFLSGWTRAGHMPADVVVSDSSPATLADLAAKHPKIRCANADNARPAGQDIVFLALHAPVLKELLPALKAAVKPDAVVVSLAPKITLAKLAEMLGGFTRLARIIPNAPSCVGAGYNPVAFSPALPAAERDLLRQLLTPLGQCPEVAEEKLEAYAILTAMGPTYFWYQCYELLALAQSFGLSAQEAQAGLSQMLAGTARTITDSGLKAEQVQDLIPSKPMAEIEPTITEAYRGKLTAVMEKLRS